MPDTTIAIKNLTKPNIFNIRNRHGRKENQPVKSNPVKVLGLLLWIIQRDKVMHSHKMPAVPVPGGCKPESKTEGIHRGTESGISFPPEEKQPHKYRGGNRKLMCRG